MRRIFAGLLVGLLMVGTVGAEPRLRRYKVVTGDGGTSVIEGTRISIEGNFVLVWIGRRLDTAVFAPKYVTELPPEVKVVPESPVDEPEPSLPAPSEVPPGTVAM